MHNVSVEIPMYNIAIQNHACCVAKECLIVVESALMRWLLKKKVNFGYLPDVIHHVNWNPSFYI